MRILFFITIVAFTLRGDSTDVKESIDYYKIGAIGGVTAGAFIYGHAIQNDIWWKDEKTDFFFNWQQDWSYAYGADKLGHLYFPWLASSLYGELFQWSGMKKNDAFLWSGIVALSYQTYVELRDGFSPCCGFSWGDMIFNTIGAAFPLAKANWPALSGVSFKISYYPSERFKNNSHKVIIDDYESTYHWLTVNINDYLAEENKSFWFDFINAGIGHGVKNLDTPAPYHEIFFAVDLNLNAIKWDFIGWKILQKAFSFYRIPSPAIRLSPDFALFGLKF